MNQENLRMNTTNTGKQKSRTTTDKMNRWHKENYKQTGSKWRRTRLYGQTCERLFNSGQQWLSDDDNDDY